MVGYNVPEIAAAVRDQAARSCIRPAPIENQIALAERIAELSGIADEGVLHRVRYRGERGGPLLATQFRRSNQVLAIRNSYHGRSYAAMGITGNRGWSASALTPVNVSYVHGGYRLRSPSVTCQMMSTSPLVMTT
jgi:4-aminobutyrate aminotransferase